jgi:RNA polymerase sigma-70 factor (ECF subfamily)
MSDSELARLVEQGQAGDQRALRALFDRFQRRVFAQCLIASKGDRDAALDLTQETFVRAFRSLESLDAPEKLGGWLASIAANLCRTRGAQDLKRREVLSGYALEQDAPAPSDAAGREERIATVRRVLEKVEDPLLQQIVQLKYGEPEHTTRAIAAKLAIPHGTVTVKLMRFRAAIKRDLVRALVESDASEEAA